MQCEVLHLYVFLLLWFMCVNCKLAHKTKFFKKSTLKFSDYVYLITLSSEPLN